MMLNNIQDVYEGIEEYKTDRKRLDKQIDRLLL